MQAIIIIIIVKNNSLSVCLFLFIDKDEGGSRDWRQSSWEGTLGESREDKMRGKGKGKRKIRQKTQSQEACMGPSFI